MWLKKSVCKTWLVQKGILSLFPVGSRLSWWADIPLVDGARCLSVSELPRVQCSCSAQMVYEGIWWELFFAAPDQWCPHADSTAVHADQALVAVFSCAFSDSVYGKTFSCIRSILEMCGLCGTGDTSWCPCNTVFAMSCLVVSLHKHWLKGGSRVLFWEKSSSGMSWPPQGFATQWLCESCVVFQMPQHL